MMINQPTHVLSEIWTVEEVVGYLKVMARHVYKSLSEHKIPTFKMDGTWRFKQSDTEAWISASSAMYFSTDKKVRGAK